MGEVNPQKLEAFMGKMVTDMSAAMSGPLVLMGLKLGLYKALAERGPTHSEVLAEATGIKERYVREWLAAQAASGFVEYDRGAKTFSMSPEQQVALADENSPFFVASGFDLIASAYIDEPKISEAFRAGRGFGWHEHHECLFRGTERFFRTSYRAHLISEWLPALDGVEDKLKSGAKVADVGCGHGASTILMAQAFPRSTFIGYDYHEASIQRAQEAAAEAGMNGNISFEVASGKDVPDEGFDVVAVFDCLHDMGDPVGVARRIRGVMKTDGSFMIVEPFANDDLADNLNSVGRMFYSASTMICTPGSLAQDVGLGLGAQAGEARLTEVLKEAGFSRVRKAAQTPFNMVLEARA
jgi:2-polyprenyl-3-methyl-5-hydroxy-6-metoxy-1,4-benzoquinol methylase